MIYVDDMIITKSDTEDIGKLKKICYKIWDEILRRTEVFFGELKFHGRTEWSLYDSGSIYLLTKTGMIDFKLANTPIQVNYGLRIIEGAHPAEKKSIND